MRVFEFLKWAVIIFIIFYVVHELSVYLSKQDKIPLTCPYLEENNVVDLDKIPLAH